jgi:sporulation protein YlmC with PRC-barrel domain
MTPDGRIKLVSELLDLPLVDSEGCYCGIVDDIEFTGTKELRLKALMVGPGAYEGRMLSPLFWLIKKLAGDRITRVPIDKVRTIGSVVKLECTGKAVGLERSEGVAAKWIPKGGAL